MSHLDRAHEDFESAVNEPDIEFANDGYEHTADTSFTDAANSINSEDTHEIIEPESEPEKPHLKPNPLDAAMQANSFQKARLALFNSNLKDKDPGKEYPVMSGYIENRDFKVNISGFIKTSRETGRDYLSLSIGSTEHEKVYGRLFKDEKEGKQNHYFGAIEKTEDTGQKDEANKTIYRTLWRLEISAKKRRSENPGAPRYISGDVYIKGALAEEGRDEAEDVAF